MKKTPVIIDCDPGHDDAIAILWALSAPELQIKGITTVAGNQTLEKVTTNAIRLLTLAGRYDIPVAAGASKPLVKKPMAGGVIHGETGLDGPSMPEAGFEPVKMNAVELMIKIIEESEEKITLLPLGPQTNIAALFLLRPDLKSKIERISLMGGGRFGNWTPAAEYNIWADPEAAHIVFNSGIPIIMAGLDITQKAYVTREENEMLRGQGNKISIFAAELIDFYSKYHYEVEGFPGCTLHDPCAVAALIHPELFKSQLCNVEVETKGELTTGMTIIDTIDYRTKIFDEKVEKNTSFLYEVDREGFVKEFLAAMKSLN